MICKDTNEKIVQLQQHKKQVASELVTEDAGFIKKLNKDAGEFCFANNDGTGLLQYFWVRQIQQLCTSSLATSPNFLSGLHIVCIVLIAQIKSIISQSSIKSSL